MKVLDFMNRHEDWEDLLTQPPYNIIVKHDGDYILLKYSQFNSDFNNEIVRECRGSIFYKIPDMGYICVCRAFDKFFNQGEPYAANIDWNSAVVEEKVDGSLIKLWYHNNKWHISTNGTIDAFKANIDGTPYNFGMLTYQALGGVEKFRQFTHLLDKNWIYMFELVSPKSRVTIFYPETKLYYLGERNLFSMRENKWYRDFMQDSGVLCPKEFNLHSLDDCLEYVKTMTKDEEGFVIRDNSFNRMKLKSPEYLFAFHCNNNGAITTGRIIDMIKEEKIDDFLAYCPQYTDHVNKVINAIGGLEFKLKMEWFYVEKYAECDRKEFANRVSKSQYKDFLFKKYSNRNLTVYDYIISKPTSKIKDMIEVE